MNLKIFTKLLSLENTDSDKILLGKQALDDISAMQNEIVEFLRDKKDAKIEWCQSSGSASEMLFQTKAIPFTQLTAIIQW